MKCIAYDAITSATFHFPSARIVRVSNEEAAKRVAEGLAYYVAKNVWKAQRALEQKETK